MKLRRIGLFVFLGLQLLAIGPMASASSRSVDQSSRPLAQEGGLHNMLAGATPFAPVATPVTPYLDPVPDHLTHPCAGLASEPPFSGLAPLSIAYVPGICSGGYGDIGVWQNAGHDYVMVSGFSRAFYHIWNVDDPYNPVLLRTQPLPSGATASLSIFPFKQGTSRYMSLTARGSSPGCGFYIYNVDDPANPQFVSRKQGADWCTVHENFISTDANGDADYAWLAMSGESGSGIKMVVLDLQNLSAPVETGRYQRPDNIGFVHDVTVMGNLVFLAHWDGGVIIHDKQTLAHNVNPTPLNPLDSIRPSGFRVHQAWPSSDGNHLFIEDEYENSSSRDKIKLYNITDVANPFFEQGILGQGSAQNSQAHNMKVKNIGPGVDLLLDGWYLAGTRAFQVDYNNSPPSITQTAFHQLRQNAGPGFGGVWGVDFLPCTVRGIATTCLYSSDLTFGLYADALDTNPILDPYNPEVQVLSPTEGQQINTCTFTINGTSHDYWTGVSQIEVSIDGGAWQAAAGTNSWSFDWEITANGPHQIRVRGTDAAGNTDIKTVNVNVTADCTLLTPTPTLPVPTDTPVPPTVTSTSVPPTLTTAATSTSIVPTLTATAIVPTVTRTSTSTPVEATASVTTVPPTGTAVSTATATVAPPSATTTAVACAIRFEDVPSTNTFYPFVQCLACRNIIGGYPCGGAGEPCNANNDPYFRYNNPITRGQISKIVALSAGLTTPPGTRIYEDVPESSPFFVFVQQLSNAGYMGGYPCGTMPAEPCVLPGNRPYFRPNSPASRGQLSKIVSNAAGFSEPVTGQTYTDVLPSNTFYEPIERLSSRNVMGGYPCGGPGEPCDSQNRPYFRPAANVTRGQATKIVSNAFFPACSTP